MCDSLKNNYVFPSWVYEFFAKKTHRNEARQVWEQYFETLPIQLNNYCLITMNKRNLLFCCKF